ncbi:hypothetical protein PoMZ_05266 [Pyricularia oryzae]|uniref:Uncharacterized protein n=1 Tax=Pyricularia oryzae TaxID=318829 RepID=A0A4P7NNA3_PYROR|nr:hypothetical protein PoMZ_05266 [Pyricularia oryzae]
MRSTTAVNGEPGPALFMPTLLERVASSSCAMPGIVHAHAAGARGILLVRDARQPLRDRGVVAVAAHKGAQVRLRPVIPDGGKVVFHLVDRPRVKDLVENQHAHVVGQLQELGRRRVVRSPHRVAAHVLEHLELAPRRRHVEGRAQAAQIVVLANALKVDALAVDVESVVGVLQVADTKVGLVSVEELPIARVDARDGDVEVGSLVWLGSPKGRV